MKKLALSILTTSFISLCATAIDHNEFIKVANKCANNVAIDTLIALVKTESSFNEFAIGVVGSRVKQPKSQTEALKTVDKLIREGKNFSIGLAQINKSNFKKFNVTPKDLFDPCTNLTIAQMILRDCYKRAKGTDQERLSKALSCYYSGNEITGIKHGYVNKVLASSDSSEHIPSIKSLYYQSKEINSNLVIETTSTFY